MMIPTTIQDRRHREIAERLDSLVERRAAYRAVLGVVREEIVEHIRELDAMGVPRAQIARQAGLSRQVLYGLLDRKAA